MGISIYYTAKREKPLTSEEHFAIDKIIEKYSVDRQIEEYMDTGQGLNWESFGVYDAEEKEVFVGATKLPNNSDDASWIAIQHWCNALTEIRHILTDAEWEVSVEDHQIQWDEKGNCFDPTK